MTIPHKALADMLGYKKNVSVTIVRELADAKLEYGDIMPFRQPLGVYLIGIELISASIVCFKMDKP